MASSAPQQLHILRINGIAQQFFTIKENALKELVRIHLSGVPNATVETIQAKGTEGIFDRGIEVFLVDVDTYMKRAKLQQNEALINPALLFPCLMMRRIGADVKESYTPMTRDELNNIISNTYLSEAGEGINKPVRPSYRPPMRYVRDGA